MVKSTGRLVARRIIKGLMGETAVEERILEEEEIAYHTTLYRNLPKIRREGLIPKNLEGEVKEILKIDRGIYLDLDKENAYEWPIMLIGSLVESGKRKFAILKVSLPLGTRLFSDPSVLDIPVSEGGPPTNTSFIIADVIPPERIEVIDTVEAEAG